jgi:hypothetical protein
MASAALVWTTMTMVVAGWTLAAHTTVYPEGAPPGFAGGFGEQSCHGCHFHAEPNSPPGRATLSGVPERFVGGQRYDLTVTVERPGMKLAGFQLTARAKNDGAQAGQFAASAADAERIGLEVQNNVQYVNQKKQGSTSGEAVRWSLTWTAPHADQPVMFHLAANAADGDGSAEGDYVYTATLESSPLELFPGCLTLLAPLSESAVSMFARGVATCSACQRCTGE